MPEAASNSWMGFMATSVWQEQRASVERFVVLARPPLMGRHFWHARHRPHLFAIFYIAHYLYLTGTKATFYSNIGRKQPLQLPHAAVDKPAVFALPAFSARCWRSHRLAQYRIGRGCNTFSDSDPKHRGILENNLHARMKFLRAPVRTNPLYRRDLPQKDSVPTVLPTRRPA